MKGWVREPKERMKGFGLRASHFCRMGKLTEGLDVRTRGKILEENILHVGKASNGFGDCLVQFAADILSLAKANK